MSTESNDTGALRTRTLAQGEGVDVFVGVREE